MYELDDMYVKRGLWTNWSKGPIMGKTITTDIGTGTILVSVLALFCTLATTHLWHTLTFLIHQLRSRGTHSDGLFWQQQAILRTLPTPSALVSGNFGLWWAWRQKSRKALLRCSVPVIFSAIYIILSMAATLSTNYIIDTTGLEVLVASPRCGHLDLLDPEVYQKGEDYLINMMNSAVEVSERCQNVKSSPSFCSNIYTKPTIPLKIESPSCPFGPSMCRNEPNTTFSMDTGIKGLNEIFGVNFKNSDEVKFRKKEVCSALPVDGHYQYYKEPSKDNSTSPRLMLAIKYGQLSQENDHFHIPNTTLTIPVVDKTTITTYGIVSFSNPSKLQDTYHWDLIPDLNRTDADVGVVFLQFNSLQFQGPVDDPVYPAHRKALVRGGTMYLPDHPIGVIGCTKQYQFCIAKPNGKDHCTPLQGIPLNLTESEFPGATPNQMAQIHILFNTVRRLNDVFIPFSSAGMTNKKPVYSTQQWSDQFKTSLTAVLSLTRSFFVGYALGPAVHEPSVESWVKKPSTDAMRALCAAQKMKRNGGFANINFFGLVFVTTFACVIVIIDLTLVEILILIRKYTETSSPRLDRWVQDGILQLQRRAFESQGKGIWDKLHDEVPVTRYDEKLEELSVETSISVLRRTGTALGIVQSKLSRSDTTVVDNSEGFNSFTRQKTDTTKTSRGFTGGA